MPAPDANPVLDAINANQETTRNIATSIANITGAQSEILRSISTDLDTASSYKSDSVTTAETGLLHAQKSAEATKILVGSDALDPNSLIPALAAKFRDSLAQSQQLSDEIGKRDSVSFFDNPLAYIAWQFDKPAAIRNYNRVANDANNSIAAIDAVNEATTAAANAAKASAQTLTTDQIAKDAFVASVELKSQAADMRYKGLSTDIEGLKAIQSGNQAILQGRIETWKIQEQVFQEGVENERLNLQRQQFNVMMEEHRDKLAAKQTLRTVLSTGLGVMGKPAPDDGTLTQLEVLYNSTEGKKELQPIIDAGINKLLANDTAIAPTPGEAFVVASKVNPRFAQDTKEKIGLDFIKSVPDTLVRLDPKAVNKPEEIKEKINEYMRTTVLPGWNQNPEASPSYKAPSFLQMQQDSDVAGTQFFKILLAPQVTAGVQSIEPNQMVAQGVEAIKQGTLKIEDVARGVATYYSKATQYNSLHNHTVGIPPQVGYPVTISGTQRGTSFSDGKYDLTDTNKVKAAVMSLLNAGNSVGLPAGMGR
jgi:hypothetical protein